MQKRRWIGTLAAVAIGAWTGLAAWQRADGADEAARAPAAGSPGEVSFGCYLPVLGSRRLAEEVKLSGSTDRAVHGVMARRPPYYRFTLPADRYKVTVHYLTAGQDDKGRFAVEIDGQQAAKERSCFVPHKKTPERVEAASVTCDVRVGDDGVLTVRFPREYDQEYGITALEVVGGSSAVRINCGGGAVRGADGTAWLADRELPFPDVTIRLDANDTAGRWVDIGGEILAKLRAAGAEPVVKWDGRYTRHINGIFWDRSGRVLVNLSAIGLWEYGGPGGTMRRVDGGAYTSVAKGWDVNPYGPGFVLFSSHGFNPQKTYQALSWDGGKTFVQWEGNRNFGAVDWTQAPPRTFVTDARHASTCWVTTDGARTFRKVSDDKKPGCVRLGALGEGVLIRCLSHREKDTPGIGIYRSADLGQTWRKVSDLDVGGNAGCSPVVAYKGRAYIATPDGLIKSTDRGETWTLIEGSPALAYAVLIGKTDRHLLGFGEAGGYESTDAGATWKKVMPPPPPAKKWMQSHRYYDFAWDVEHDVVYASAPDAAWRFVRK